MTKDKLTSPYEPDKTPTCPPSEPNHHKIIVDADTRRLLQLVKEGDTDAFDSIYNKWSMRIFSLLKKLLHSTEDAEDILQDVFVRIWENRESIDLDKNFNSFIYRVARNTALKFIEKLKVRNNYAVVMPYDEEDLNADEYLIAKETEKTVKDIISAMPDERREIYLLSYRDELDHDAIAAKLKIPKEKVYRELYMARKELRKILPFIIALLFLN